MKISFTVLIVLFAFVFSIQRADVNDDKQHLGAIVDSYTVNELGAYNHIIPISAPPAVNKIQPNISLVYDSRNGESEVGVGWNLTGISQITRSPHNIAQNGEKNTIQFDGSDAISLDGQNLILIAGGNLQDRSVYRTENETFSKITAHGIHKNSTNSPEFFVVQNPIGWKYYYGTDNTSKVAHSQKTNEVLAWAISMIEDPNGNFMRFYYEPTSTAKLYISRIDYGANHKRLPHPIEDHPFTLFFKYEKIKDDVSSIFLNGLEIVDAKLLTTIQIYSNINNTVLKSYELHYSFDNGSYLLDRLSLTAMGKKLLPSTFSYKLYNPKYSSSKTVSNISLFSRFHLDLNVDGKLDILINNTGEKGNDNFVYTILEDTLIKHTVAGLENINLQEDEKQRLLKLGDYDGNNLTDVLIIYPNRNPDLLLNHSTRSKFIFKKADVTQFALNKTYWDEKNKSSLVTGDFDGNGITDIFYLDNDLNHSEFVLFKNDVLQRLQLPSSSGVVASKTRLYTGDFNGNGKDDILYYNPTSNTEEKSYLIEIKEEKPSVSIFSSKLKLEEASDEEIMSFDINSDGNSDLIKTGKSIHTEITLSNGFTFLPSQKTNLKLTSDNKRIYIGNFTGSKKMQILQVDKNNHAEIYEYSNDLKLVYQNLDSSFSPINYKQENLYFADDVNVDGITDFLSLNVLSSDKYEVKWNTSPNIYRNKLLKVTNGLGQENKISYSNIFNPTYTQTLSVSYPTSLFYGPYSLVDTLFTSNTLELPDAGTKSYNKETFKYENLLINKIGRGFLGFKEIISKDLSTGILTRKFYEHEFPLTGKLIKETKTSRSGVDFFCQENKWRFQMYKDGHLFERQGNEDVVQARSALGLILRNVNDLEIIDTLDFLLTARMVKNSTQLHINRSAIGPLASDKLLNSIELINSIQSLNENKITYLPILSTVTVLKKELDNKQTNLSTIYNYFGKYGYLDSGVQTLSDTKKIVTKNKYRYDETNRWILGLLVETEVTALDINCNPSSESHVTHYDYDQQGNLISKIREPYIDEFKLSTQYSYDDCGNLTKTSINSFDGISREFTYAFEDRFKIFPTKITNGLNQVTKYEYDYNLSAATKKIDPNGLTTIFKYDAVGNLIKTIGHNGQIESIEYEVFPKDPISVYGKNIAYKIVRTISGHMPTEEYYDYHNKPRFFKSPGINKTLIEVVRGERASSRPRLNGRNRLKLPDLTIKTNQAILTETIYDERGNIQVLYDPYFINERTVESSHLKTPSACFSFVSGERTFKKFRYDDLNREITHFFSDGKEQGTRYQANYTEIYNPKGQIRQTYINGEGKIQKVVDADGNYLEYEFDVWGNPIKIKHRDLQTTIYYDKIGRKKEIVDPAFGTIRYEYNSFDEVVSEYNSKHGATAVSKLVYDKVGRIISKTTPDGIFSWIYDIEMPGMVSEVNGPNYNKTFSYDEKGRVTKEVFTAGTQSYVSNFDYDAASNLSSKRFPSGLKLNYKYTNGILTRIEDSKGATIWRIENINADGNIVDKTFGNGIRSLYQYHPINRNLIGIKTFTNKIFLSAKPVKLPQGDSTCIEGELSQEGKDWKDWIEDQINKRPISKPPFPTPFPNQPDVVPSLDVSTIDNLSVFDKKLISRDVINRYGELSFQINSSSNPDIQDLEFSYNELNNVKVKSDILNNTAYKYEYDELNRLLSTTSVINGLEVDVDLQAYSSYGNIITNTKVGKFRYDAANPSRLVSTTMANSSKTFSYDVLGNVQKAGSASLSYNCENKVTSISNGNNSVKYTYGASGELVKRDVLFNDAITLESTYINTDFEVRNSNGSIEYYHYIGTKDNLVGVFVIDKATPSVVTKYFVHADQLGSIDKITDDKCNIIAEKKYDSWGNKSLSLESPALYVNKGYTAHNEEDIFGLVIMNGRPYDPKIGRFYTADPFVQDVSNIQSLNRYAYVLNNPVNAVDPSGFFLKKVVRGVSKAVFKYSPIAVYTGLAGIIDPGLKRDYDKFVDRYGEQIIVVAAAIAITVATGGAGAGLTTSIFINTLISGAISGAVFSSSMSALTGGGIKEILSSALSGAASGAVSAGLFYGIGEAFVGVEHGFGTVGYGAKITSHGVAGGVQDELFNKGDFKTGFLSAAITQGFAPAINNMDKNNLGISFQRTTAAALIGGVTALAIGGDPVMGAFTASFSRAYNDENHLRTLKTVGSVMAVAGAGLTLTGAGAPIGGAMIAGGIVFATAADAGLAAYHFAEGNTCQGWFAVANVTLDVATAGTYAAPASMAGKIRIGLTGGKQVTKYGDSFFCD